ncbi:MAG: type I restriction endonuclease subunit R, partial [Thermodesulfovibrionales bacterium]
KNPDNNDWLVVNQFTVIEGQNNRRPDVVVFVNGIPLGVIELKNPSDENATIKDAFNQFQTYKNEIPSLFPYNEILVVSDGIEARLGTLTADWEWFLPWRTITGDDLAPKGLPELEVMIKGVFEKQRFLDLLRYFIVFEVDGSEIIKKIAGYHQFHAVNKAVDCTIKAASPGGDKRVGVVWHTQGSGKSLTMAFYAGKIIQHPEMQNPTLVVLTDRNDLDDQLFGTFSRCKDLLRQTPVQAESREHLREILNVASGGVVFTTVQKFFNVGQVGLVKQVRPLSTRRNIVVIADEAHRSQYDFIDGFARHIRDALPNASFIGFTGTPIEKADRNTPAVFGNYISIYDIQRAVEDGATVRIYYEARLAKLELKSDERPKIDPEFEEVTEGEEQTVKEKLKRKWAQLEAMVGTEKRVGLVAKDIIDHFEKRLEAMDGKGMIVCMSRRICVDLYNAIIKLRPEWHSDDDDRGFLKVVMTGSASDPSQWQQHIRNKMRREALANNFKKPEHPFKLVIVRDMWLTGFDAPSLHTMYIDKPMRGHGLMQAIARVNRVFKDKPGGLVVDYLGIADELKKALSDYTEKDRDMTGIPQEEAVAIMLEKFEVVSTMFHGFDYTRFFTSGPSERLTVIKEAMEHILSQDDGKNRYMQAVTELSKAFALSVPHDKAIEIRDHVGFFQTVKASLAKNTTVGAVREPTLLDSAVRQIVSKAIASEEVIDIFASAGLKKPDISILSDEFLEEVRHMPQRNLAFEVLKKLLYDEIKARSKRNLVLSRSFAEMLEKTIRRYQNRTIDAAKVIMELIELAKEMREAHKRGERLNLTEEELAFYDALETNDSAVKVLGDETLRTIARELVQTVKKNVTIDWTVKESVKAKLRTLIKRILRKYGYPPDKQEKATQTVLSQAELLCAEWVA